MSDVSIAPPSAAPAAPQAPASNEVAINQNPVGSQNPVGPQAPPAEVAPRGSEHRPQSRREAIQAAFERANKPQQARNAEPPKAAPKAAEAKAGHNQPPEDTPKEFNLKKPPSEQNDPQPQPRDRGRFAPRQAQQPGTSGNAPDHSRPLPDGQPGRQYARLPAHAPFAEPVPRMAEHAKRDWAAAPESVRGEVHRMHGEFSKAAQRWHGIAEAYKPIEPFMHMARQGGTTLQQALTNYVGIEKKLQADPIAGLDLIVHNLGLKDPRTGQPLGLRDIAYHVLSSTPEQLKQVQQGNAQTAAQHQIGALYNEVRGLKQTLQQWQGQQQFAQRRSAVDNFADSHPRFDELGDLIEGELRLGFDIETAYRRAELLRPAARAAQTGNPSAQTRPTDRSIHGAPDVAPSNGASRPTKKSSPTARDAVKNAMARMNGAH